MVANFFKPRKFALFFCFLVVFAGIFLFFSQTAQAQYTFSCSYDGTNVIFDRANCPTDYSLPYQTYCTDSGGNACNSPPGSIFNGSSAINSEYANCDSSLIFEQLPKDGNGNNFSSYSFSAWTTDNINRGLCTISYSGGSGESWTGIVEVFNYSTGDASLDSFLYSQASWTITGPKNVTGSGDRKIYYWMPEGSYTIIWNDVPNFSTPASQTLTLTEGGMAIKFNGKYQPTSIGVSVDTSSISKPASWTITNNKNSEIITGSGYLASYLGKVAGDYTITWGTVPGYGAPDPQTLTLTSGGTINFNGKYISGKGTVKASTNPSQSIGGPFPACFTARCWTIIGPPSYGPPSFNQLYGSNFTGLKEFFNVPTGTYIVTYSSSPGYTTPSPQTFILTDGKTIEFKGEYIPLLGTINVSSNIPEASWTVNPGNITGSGEFASYPGLAANTIYTIVWNNVTGYTYTTLTPPSQTLTSGGTITFSATYYVATVGTINVSSNQSNAWTIKNSNNDVVQTGDGMTLLATYPNIPTETYTIIWGDVPGYTMTPTSPTTQTLNSGETINFIGDYQQSVGGGGNPQISSTSVNPNIPAGCSVPCLGP